MGGSVVSDHPTNQPLFTNLLVKKLVEQSRNEPPRRRGVDGRERLWASDAGSCARKIGLALAGYDASDPIDGPGLWVTNLGNIIHTAIQEVMVEIYGDDAKCEFRVTYDDLSLSARLDGLVTLANGKVICYELKTMGGFGFDKSVGLNRKAYKLNEKGPEGPRASAKLQGALNALAAGADELRIGHVSMEAVSKQLAEKVNWSDEQRILAEWVYPRSVFEPWAKAEKRRLASILAVVDAGRLPDRVVIDDNMKVAKLNPDDNRPPWQCTYCAYRETCSVFGPGEPALPVKAAS